MSTTPGSRTRPHAAAAHAAEQAGSRARESASGRSRTASRSMSAAAFPPTSWPSTRPPTSITSSPARAFRRPGRLSSSANLSRVPVYLSRVKVLHPPYARVMPAPLPGLRLPDCTGHAARSLPAYLELPCDFTLLDGGEGAVSGEVLL